MAESDLGDKTEDPTPRRREDAREEGQVARSVELTAAASLLGAVLLLRTLGPMILDGFMRLVRAHCGSGDVTVDGALTTSRLTLVSVAEFTAPFLLAVVAITIAIGAVQSGLILSWKKLEFKPEHLSPIAGVKRMFSPEALTRLGNGIVKLLIVGAVAWHALAGDVERVLQVGGLSAGGMFLASCSLVFDLALRLALVLLILGIVDYLLARWRLERQLRMTKQEVRDELKKMEGDPLIKQRRRQIQQRLLAQRIRSEVPKADVVVTNPTEYAVALKYDEHSMAAPRVVAKGVDLLAQRIRQIAHEHGVPVVQRPPLARALYASVEIGRDVPPAFYRAVAEVLAYVYQLARRAG